MNTGHAKTLGTAFLSMNRTRFFWIGILLVLLAGCTSQKAPVMIKDGEEYGRVAGAFRHRWWNYYERALSYAEGEFFDHALADLDQAVRQRVRDQRMARTYGMHFIDYFPHRERGVILYRRGELEQARIELELSLAQFPSAKAQYYLDRVRQAQLRAVTADVRPPQIRIEAEAAEIWTREDPVLVSGMVEDPSYVTSVSIAGQPLFMTGARSRVDFNRPLTLAQGRHVIEVQAANLLGAQTSRALVVHVDRQGPLITVEGIEVETEGAGANLRLSGFVYDEGGVAALSVDDQAVSVTRQTEVEFSQTVAPGRTWVSITAIDGVGNQSRARVDLTAGVSPQKAALWLPGYVATPKKILLASASEGGFSGFMQASLFGSDDTTPPMIDLDEWTQTATVLVDKIYLSGRVSDDTGVEALTLNGRSILRRKGKSIYWNRFVRLKAGENRIVIEARDEAGNTTDHTLTIQRNIPQALQLEERLSMSILPFEHKGEISTAGLAFQDNLILALMAQNRFNVVERDRLDAILAEQKLSRTALIDQGTAVKVGRLAAARAVMAGSMIQTRTGIEIVGRLIDTQSSQILATQDVYDEASDLDAMRLLADGMANKFHREFPLLDGQVIKQKGQYVFTTLGQDKIKLQRYLIVYREELLDPDDPELGADNVVIGRVRVVQVTSKASKTKLLEAPAVAIGPDDRVVTE